MLIVMSHNATTADVDAVVLAVSEMGFTAAPIPGRDKPGQFPQTRARLGAE